MPAPIVAAATPGARPTISQARRRWGNSLGVRLPATIARAAKLHPVAAMAPLRRSVTQEEVGSSAATMAATSRCNGLASIWIRI